MAPAKKKTSAPMKTSGPATGLLDAMKFAQEAASAQAARDLFNKKDDAIAKGIIGGGGTSNPVKGTTEDVVDPYAWEKALRAEQQSSAVEALRGIMNSYGLGDLMGQITTWVQEGKNEDAVLAMIRTTEQLVQLQTL